MSTMHPDTLNDWTPQTLSQDERRRIESDIRSLRAGIADFDTEIACSNGSWRTWCIQVRDGMRRDLVLLWAQLEA